MSAIRRRWICAGATFSEGIYRLNGSLLVVLDVSQLLQFGKSRGRVGPEPPRVSRSLRSSRLRDRIGAQVPAPPALAP